MLQRMNGLLKRRGFEIYSRPFELNIVGLRNKNAKKSDEIHVFFKTNKRNWNYFIYGAITDLYVFFKDSLKPPLLLNEGQFENAYKLGQRKGKTALLEVKPVDVILNFDRNAFLSNGKVRKGVFGTDLISAEGGIAKGDEGCQIFLSEKDYQEFIKLCEKHEELYGNQFTYTLIDFRAAKTNMIKRGIAIAASFLTSLFFGLLMKERKK